MDHVSQHLFDLSQRDLLPPAHKDYLVTLKNGGFEPKVIYDIGSCVKHWTNFAKTLWPDAEYILFDAFDKAEFLYSGYKYHMGVLGNEDGKIVKFYENELMPGGNSYYRELAFDNGKYFPVDAYRLCTMQRLDTVVRERNFPKPDLVKIDVQGAEKDIIDGGRDTINNAQHLIVEMQRVNYNDQAPTVEVTKPFIEGLGFKCVAPLFCDNGPDGDYGFVKVYGGTQKQSHQGSP